ncbi:MAG: GNAT family N-acetyltransferase [Clostridia bacterium]|nr:GNAT family N-acetyltransferase [Clostridia bacterium]
MKELFRTIPRLAGKTIELRALTQADADALDAFTHDDRVYRYLPTFLFERKYPTAAEVIGRLYTECLEESLILGIFRDGAFCGLAELYGFQRPIRKISVGCRLAFDWWRKGIAAEAIGVLISYLERETEIEIIAASTMAVNPAAGEVLKKNGFTLVAHAAPEDWGFEKPVPTDKWIY